MVEAKKEVKAAAETAADAAVKAEVKPAAPVEKEEAKAPAAKKTTARKTAAKKTEPKTAEPKAAAKKTAESKTAVKKTAAKAAEPKKETAPFISSLMGRTSLQRMFWIRRSRHTRKHIGAWRLKISSSILWQMKAQRITW